MIASTPWEMRFCRSWICSVGPPLREMVMTSLTSPLASACALIEQIISSRQPLPVSVLLMPITKSPPAAAVPAGSLPAGSVPAGSVPAGSVPDGSVVSVEAPAPMPVAMVRASADSAATPSRDFCVLMWVSPLVRARCLLAGPC